MAPVRFPCHGAIYGCPNTVPDRPGRFLYCCRAHAEVFNASPAFLREYDRYIEAEGRGAHDPTPLTDDRHRVDEPTERGSWLRGLWPPHWRPW
jgi:hypothetical protein